jgi:hypothetical protein
VAFPKKEESPTIPPPGLVAPPDPPKTKKDELASRITLKQKDKIVDFTLDLKLQQTDFDKLHWIAFLMADGLRGEMEAAAGLVSRHDLAKAVKTLVDKGLTDRGVLPGSFPPGAFPRSAGPGERFSNEPMQRVSWMAGLLPFLGQDTLYRKINYHSHAFFVHRIIYATFVGPLEQEFYIDHVDGISGRAVHTGANRRAHADNGPGAADM